MSQTSGRLIAVSDVHGCVHALDTVLEAIDPAADDEIVFLGDLIDQGRESREVLQRIIELKKQCRVVLIQGNHEEMLYAARENEESLRYWERCGGVQTISSYRFGGGLQDIPPEHWALLDECRPYYETDDFIFTHANYTHDEELAEQPGYQLRWALFDPGAMRPHKSGKPVIVGHTEQREGEIVDLGFAMCIDTACWKYGWLTAIEPATGEMWQASRWGVMRETGDEHQAGHLTVLLQSGPAQH